MSAGKLLLLSISQRQSFWTDKTLKLEAVVSYEVLATVYQLTLYYIQVDLYHLWHCSENVRFLFIKLLLFN